MLPSLKLLPRSKRRQRRREITTSRSRRKLNGCLSCPEYLNAILDLIGGPWRSRGGSSLPLPPMRSAGLFFPPLWPQTLFQKAAIDKSFCGFQSLAPPPPRWCFWGARGRGVRGGRRREGLPFRGCSNQSPGTPCSRNRSAVRCAKGQRETIYLSGLPKWPKTKALGQPPLTSRDPEGRGH